MNNYKLNSLTLAILFMLISTISCKKDLGNYNYKAINEISFTEIDTVNGYSIDLGDTLQVSPSISGSLDKNLSGDYSYEWKLLINAANSDSERILSTNKTLDYLVTLKPNGYLISYGVKDNKTGITWLKEFPLTVTTPYYQGWLVLNKVNDSSRLDFLSYRNSSFIQHTDILTKLNTGIPPQGEPYQVFFSDYYYSSALQGVMLLTASGTNILDPENFSYSPSRNIEKYMLGNVPADFKAQTVIYGKGDYVFYDNLFLYSNGSIYFQAYGAFFYGTPLNTDGSGVSFHASPYTAISGGYLSTFVLYDETNRRFVYINKQSFTSYSGATPIAPELNFPTGEDLLYMTDNDVLAGNGTNYAYAILKDPGADNFYMLRFSFVNDQVQASSYYQPIVATDFALAEHYAISPNLGYLFYSVGGKVYEYDLFLKTTKLMIDKGNSKISLLSFDTYNKPDEFQNLLNVGSYDPAGAEGSNGVFEQYSVPPVNGDLVQQYQWTGFGQIVSVSYRYR